MSTTKDKYLILRGKNKDIYFIQKRLSKEAAAIYGKDFIKKSLKTTDIHVARAKRDKILYEIEEMTTNNNKDIALHQENTADLTKDQEFETNSINKLSKSEYMHVPIDDDTDLDDLGYSNDSNFTLFSIRIPKIPKKEEIIMKIDAFIPIVILILTLFIAFIV